MFRLFKKKSKVDKLNSKYKKLLEEAYKLSTINRKMSDAKAEEAAELLKVINQNY